MAALAFAFVAGAWAFGAPVIKLLFGEKFAPAAPLLVLLAVMQGIRFFRMPPAVAGMAHGETQNSMWANIVRAAFVPIALIVAMTTKDLRAIIIVGIVGELVSTCVAFGLAKTTLSLGNWRTVGLFCITTAALAVFVVLPNLSQNLF
jgi:O-antigen/teichoic acid export membrane protein